MKHRAVTLTFTGLLLGSMTLGLSAAPAYSLPINSSTSQSTIAYTDPQNQMYAEEAERRLNILHTAWKSCITDINLIYTTTVMEKDPDQLLRFCNEKKKKNPNMRHNTRDILENGVKRAQALSGMNIDQSSYEQKCRYVQQLCAKQVNGIYNEMTTKVQPALLNVAQVDPDRAFRLCNEFLQTAQSIEHMSAQDKLKIQTAFNNTLSQIRAIKSQQR